MRHGRAAIAGLLVTALLLSGCRDDDDSADDTTTTPTDDATPIGAANPCGDPAPSRPAPPGVDVADCRWTTQAEDVVGFGDAVIATAEVAAGRESGEFVVKALDASTGSPLWTTPPVAVAYDDPATDVRADGRRTLDVVHWGGEPYAAFTYLTPKESGAVWAATFVPLTRSKRPEPVTWVAPPTPDPTVATSQQYVSHDAVGAFVQATTDVIDPTTGTLRGVQTSWDGAQPTIGDGWFAEIEYGEPGFTVKSYDGGPSWDSADHVPTFADGPGVSRHAVAAFRDKLLAQWASCLRCARSLELVLHDKDGRVLDGAAYGPSLGDSVTQVLASPNERWLVVTDNDDARVVVDLDTGTLTSLAESGTRVRPLSIDDEGEIYGIDGSGNGVTVDGSTGAVTWSGDATAMLPASVTGNVALVSSTPSAQTLADERMTTTWWALATDQPTRAEVAARLAPLVYLAQNEKSPPLDASTFVEHSELRFDHGDDGVCKGEHLVAERPTESGLGDGDYTHQQFKVGFPNCTHKGQTFRTDDEVKDDDFYLDVDDPWRYRGQVDGASQAPAYWQYYAHDDGTGAYIYWLFYPYNPYGGPHQARNLHEGDWERVAVRVDGDNEPTGMTFWHHQSKETCFLPWEDVEKDGERPVAYSAKGSHGSYPTLGHQVRDNAPDDDTSRGASWRLWDNLRPAEAEDWWGYRGLWGDVSKLPHYDGVAGPFPGRYLANAVTADLQCGGPDEPDAVEGSFLGDWRSQGPVDQPGSTTTYQARLTLRQGAIGTEIGETSYPGLGCSGDLTLLQVRPGRIVVRETITDDPDDTCVPQVRITLAVDGSTLRYSTGLSAATLVRD